MNQYKRRTRRQNKKTKRRPAETKPPGIFGVPLRQSITYANVAISLVDDNGKSYIYGYVPIVVAKCGVFLKEKATGVEGIFRLSGSEKRIKELKQIFDSPDRYGKGLSWEGYTVHDAANVLRRYLNDLPEPVVPLDLYEKFRDPLRGATKQGAADAEGPQFIDNFDLDGAIARYQQLITELPPLNRQLLLYILDLLAVFAAKADENRMNSQNLAAIFQPGMLSHPAHAMAPEEYRLNQCVIIFLIENQDHFLIGMQGTAADEKTVQEVQQDKKTPNKLRKRRLPGSSNPSAQSSTASLTHSAAASPAVESANPMEQIGEVTSGELGVPTPEQKSAAETPSEPTPRASQIPSAGSLHPVSAEHTLKPKNSPPTSLHSSFNEGSDLDQVEEPPTSADAADQPDKEKRRRWRLSRRKEDLGSTPQPGVTSPRKIITTHAEASTSSVGTGSNMARRSFTGESSDPTLISAEALSSQDSGSREVKDDSKGLTGWIKNKYREAKENREERRNKSPPADRSLNPPLLPVRGKSLDIKRPIEEEKEPAPSEPQQPLEPKPPQPQSQPQP
ncbi:putative rho-gtpase-activating protein [Phaeoacremonium minimum UCRPA7]|uniref:Putative rho-gtpase-activating protein n=1 Tax=Phaeoacremonium minimum (strain UCR-PA7) TaxID=1286976 RepID=R8BFJ4_PHAM7|nr:putative rho-gtpase-activating protein [Phaeoacremonium minimum UCRPA7]EON98075.1 putative rho-gtpase-activating protein [Phaeoacremonium minimum UCRPA7]